ncbi:Dual oxidase maturation factor 1 [Holothuria leucospilota]|uniref:Dual oxidase maturation factor 1 n=1 Tax=Holothuria leucospilota TaxID=206669 RepID=A0A9Q1BNP5_HOLLE|nr:Dual oxidase maturation factor 1 [Holothuria leucospilota]
MAYSGFRNELAPTQYPRDKTPVTVDYSLAAVISAFIMLYISLLCILPGFRGKQRIIIFARFTIFHLIGMAIIGVPEKPEEGPGSGHRINYNERFYFSGPQGRIGFGRYSGRINQEFRAAQWRGMPFPILWVAEYFTLDGEDILWGRSYRLSGFYANIMLWTAWSLWILAVILSFLSIQVCSEILMLCGASMLCSNVLWTMIRYGSELIIPVASQQFLRFTFGWTFYLCLFVGILTLIFGFIVMVFNFFRPHETKLFFSFEVSEDDEPTVKKVGGNVVVPFCKVSKDLGNGFIKEDKTLKLEDVVESVWESRDKQIAAQSLTIRPRSATRQEYQRRTLRDAFRALKESNFTV